jgi:coproporphyrinogen III oxidase
MERRKQTVRQSTRQHLEEQLQRLAKQQEKTKQKLRALARQTRQAQRYRHGEYVELAGLAHLDPGTLFGGLCELAERLTDPERIARWKVRGEVRLGTHSPPQSALSAFVSVYGGWNL